MFCNRSNIKIILKNENASEISKKIEKKLKKICFEVKKDRIFF